MTAVAISIGLFLLIAALLYGLGVYAIRMADARYDRSSAETYDRRSAGTRRKHFR